MMHLDTTAVVWFVASAVLTSVIALRVIAAVVSPVMWVRFMASSMALVAVALVWFGVIALPYG